MNGEDALRRWTDRDGCGPNHRYDDDCNWRSQDERDAHLVMTQHMHRYLDCTHLANGTECEEVAMEALEALYQSGWKVERA